eukprot:scaffold4089_cov136-Isochrysis_galbana.AAC.3
MLASPPLLVLVQVVPRFSLALAVRPCQSSTLPPTTTSMPAARLLLADGLSLSVANLLPVPCILTD